MSKRLLLAVFFLAVPIAVPANDGEALFKANRCTLCHHPEENKMEQGLGPSLMQIVAVYRGEPGAMRAFLRGKAEPRLYPEHYVIMKGQLSRIVGLSDDDLNAIVQFILNR